MNEDYVASLFGNMLHVMRNSYFARSSWMNCGGGDDQYRWSRLSVSSDKRTTEISEDLEQCSPQELVMNNKKEQSCIPAGGRQRVKAIRGINCELLCF